MIELADIHAARSNIEGFVKRTPLLSSEVLNSTMGKKLWFKAELFQKTGSFKARGVVNKVRELKERGVKGCITISSGNHGQAVAFAAGRLGLEAVILVPEDTPQSKIDAARSYGAEVVVGGNFSNIKPMIEKLLTIADERQLEKVHAFSDPLIISGHGTVGLEIMEDLPEVEIVTVPVSGGGLLSGVAACLKLLKPSVKVYGVGPLNASTMYVSFQNKKITEVDNLGETIADGIRGPAVSDLTLEHCLKYVDDVVTVTDDDIITAMKLIWSRLKVMAEPSGAASFAAVLSGSVPTPDNAKTVCLLSGGNIDFKKIAKVLAK